MKALIVLAHPEPRSFNAALARASETALLGRAAEVQFSDLYAQGFDPCEKGEHFVDRFDTTRFDAQTEQRFSSGRGTLASDVQREISRLRWADAVFFHFPFWWFGMPAILKGWMDRVLAYGAVYTGGRRFQTGTCAGKRAMLCITAGSSAESVSYDGQEGDINLHLWPIHQVLNYLGFTVLQPTVISGVRGGLAGDEAVALRCRLDLEMTRHVQRLAALESSPVVLFNSGQDWNGERRLRPGAPVYSPFVRHKREMPLDEM